MKRYLLIVGLCTVGLLGAELGGYTSRPAVPLAGDVVTISQSEAAGLGRGGGGGAGSGGSAVQGASRAEHVVKPWLLMALFIGAPIFIGVAALQRSVAAAFGILLIVVLVGSFLLAPSQVKQMLVSIYQYVL
ncbi:MAG: hypothetical protein ACTHNP_02060 [Solirubrobacterales bacterium]